MSRFWIFQVLFIIIISMKVLVFISGFFFYWNQICLIGYCKSFVFGEREQIEVLAWRKIERRNLAEGSEGDNNSSLILAEKRTYRRDPLNDFKKYTGGWNISNEHYWAVSFFPFFTFFLINWCMQPGIMNFMLLAGLLVFGVCRPLISTVLFDILMIFPRNFIPLCVCTLYSL